MCRLRRGRRARVKDLAVGDAVMAVAPAAFSTHVRVKRSGVARLPRRSSIRWPAQRCLSRSSPPIMRIVELARIRAGETILIHGGAGGVGSGGTADRQGARRQGDRDGRLDREAPAARNAGRRPCVQLAHAELRRGRSRRHGSGTASTSCSIRSSRRRWNEACRCSSHSAASSNSASATSTPTRKSDCGRSAATSAISASMPTSC